MSAGPRLAKARIVNHGLIDLALGDAAQKMQPAYTKGAYLWHEGAIKIRTKWVPAAAASIGPSLIVRAHATSRQFLTRKRLKASQNRSCSVGIFLDEETAPHLRNDTRMCLGCMGRGASRFNVSARHSRLDQCKG